ncbi:hypothetical protein AMAG_05008 [Allomyces macrogynus ATCC 38327]|uniref:Large ribosomal subunit protein mL40 n=1 Tax=Allomyces macrogynus (strain ATCC 38327) TaxID=578462 RepID=A0A0L0S721_ALLM3|nr:hypothetical protein AMAG_05008 [Allomyces macrogynus ATCC 38327]|eukprot:KNE58196.1 hypothetical protein AMAG_05008 [Allomyces macrogynus ATCC 38327]
MSLLAVRPAALARLARTPFAAVTTNRSASSFGNKPAAGAAKKKGSSNAIGGDSRYPLLKEYLYASHAEVDGVAEVDADVHATIERAWSVAQRDLAAQRHADLAAKYRRLREAMVTLEQVDPDRFATAMDREGEDQYFPRLLKAPTETPAKTGWDYRRG